MGKGYDFFYRGKGRVMHIAMHVKIMKRLPMHDVIYSIVQWYLKERHDLSEVPFGPSVIVRLFIGGSFMGQQWLTIELSFNLIYLPIIRCIPFIEL